MTSIHDAGKSPAFQFYPKDFLGDGDQAGMSLQESGAYARLMCFEWNAHGKGLPDDAERCGRMVGATVGAIRKMWPSIRALFEAHPSEPGRIVHPRLEKERQKQAEFKRRQSDKGKAGATSRWGTSEQPTHGRSMAGGKPKDSRGMAGPMAGGQPNDGSSVFDLQSSDSGLKENSSEALARSEPAVLTFPVIGSENTTWALTDRQMAEWERLFPGVPILAECRKALAWVQANQRKTAKGMPKFLAAWLTRAVDSPRSASQAGGMGTRTIALVNATAGFLAGGK